MHLLPLLGKNKSKIVSSYEGEDKITYIQTCVYDMCMLADGHGGSDSVSRYLATHLCELFNTLYYALCYRIDNNTKYKSYYTSIDDNLRKRIDTIKLDSNEIVKSLLRISIDECARRQSNVRAGSTLVGFVRTRDTIVTFNVGDSRCYALDSTRKSVRLLTHDHTFKSASERRRLQTTTKIKRRLDGVLAMTRSIGDADVPRAISRPNIRTRNINEYTVLALVSDGTYEYVNDKVFKHILCQSVSSADDENHLRLLSQGLNSACEHSVDDRSHLIYII